MRPRNFVHRLMQGWGYRLAAGLLLCAWTAVAFGGEPGRALAQAVYDRPDGDDMSSRGVMVLVEEGHEPRVRTMFTYRVDKAPGEVWNLIRFTTPGDIAGTGMLTLDHPGDETDQWLYLPALERTRRIAASRKGGRFVGSDLYYEDLQDREVAQDRHTLLGEEEIQGVLCKKLESVPVDASNSVYSKRISWIHPDVLIALRTDYYKPHQGDPIKRLIVHRIEKIQGYWTVMDSTMHDLETGHRTRLRSDEVVYDRNLPDALFSRSHLADPAREAEFRP